MSLLTAPDALARLCLARARTRAWSRLCNNQKGPHGEAITLEAPPLEEFQKVFRDLRTGQSLCHGVEGGGGRKRANKLSWPLAEALRESDAKFAIHRSHCLWLACDAPIGFHNQHLTHRAGVLGQTESFGTGAANIVLATNHLLRRLVTAGLKKHNDSGAGPSAALINGRFPPHHPPRGSLLGCLLYTSPSPRD